MLTKSEFNQAAASVRFVLRRHLGATAFVVPSIMADISDILRSYSPEKMAELEAEAAWEGSRWFRTNEILQTLDDSGKEEYRRKREAFLAGYLEAKTDQEEDDE